jgi:hypothetical protein
MMKKLAHILMVVFAAFLIFVPDILEAQRRGGGGFRGGGGGRSMGARSSARMSVSRPSRGSFGGGSYRPQRSSRPSAPRMDRASRAPRADRTPRVDAGRVDRTPRVDAGARVDRTPNRDFNRGSLGGGTINIDRDINIDNNGGWWNRDYDGCCDHPVAAAAALGTAAAIGYSAGTVGTYYSTLPYYGCTETLVNGVPYWDCGSGSYYQPTFYGVDAAYVAVPPPD